MPKCQDQRGHTVGQPLFKLCLRAYTRGPILVVTFVQPAGDVAAWPVQCTQKRRGDSARQRPCARHHQSRTDISLEQTRI